MTENNWINYNTEFLPASQAAFTSQNRSFRYGDGLFESLRIFNGKIPLFPLHYQRLLKGLEHLKINKPDNFTEEFCLQQILSLAKKNKIEKNGRIRLCLFRQEGGFYLPKTNRAEFVIEGISSKNTGFEFNKNGLLVDIFPEIEKHLSPLSAYKTNNALLYIMAAIYREEHKLDDCLILNSRSRVIESIDSNLFLVKNNELYTPPLAEGCVAGVMREFILYIAEKEKIKVHETPVDLEELFEADEAFLSNAIYGTRWIKQYKSKEYENTLAKKLSELINTELIGS
jgi:branched-chain amino acid aminotransferase